MTTPAPFPTTQRDLVALALIKLPTLPKPKR